MLPFMVDTHNTDSTGCRIVVKQTEHYIFAAQISGVLMFISNAVS